jgi:D-apionolactonase
VNLRAGPLLVELHGPDLRYARSGRNEVVRRVYMAIRDLNWNTLPVEIGEVEVDDRGDEFSVRFEARNTDGEIDFSWTGTIEGTGDGSISYAMDGTAATAFPFAKIGLCIHHPWRETAGRLFRGRAPTTPVGGELPRFIGPQVHLADEGWDLPLFEPVEWLEIDLPHGERIRFDFEGDLFEMEDQRNWTDGSFKTSSTPASLGYHHSIESGGRVFQRLTFRVESAWGPPQPRGADVPELRVGGLLGVTVPPVGLGYGGALGERELGLLRALDPAHIRVDLRPGERLEEIGFPLELALFVNGDESVIDEAARAAQVERILVFDDSAEVTPLDLVDRVRTKLPGAVVGGGTNVYFNELNRNRPDPERLDVVAYSVNPQIHAFDELSMVENLEAQGETVRSTRAFSGSTPIAVTPVTLKPRYNAVAVVEESDEVGGLPRNVDPRQPTQFAAAWTLGSVKNLAEAGVASITYFETHGPRGVLGFPVFNVLAEVCSLRGRELLACESSDPLSVAGLAVEDAVLIANLEDRPKAVRLGSRALELGPYEVARVER